MFSILYYVLPWRKPRFALGTSGPAGLAQRLGPKHERGVAEVEGRSEMIQNVHAQEPVNGHPRWKIHEGNLDVVDLGNAHLQSRNSAGRNGYRCTSCRKNDLASGERAFVQAQTVQGPGSDGRQRTACVDQ